jgi:Ras-related protein Rab-43
LTEEREVSVEDAEEVCSIIPEILFSIETSAKENTNVENAFARIAEELMVSDYIRDLKRFEDF